MTDSIKAIALDVDGTLTNSQKEIPPETLAALKTAQENGIRLILASGRPVEGLMGYAKQLEMEKHHGILAAYNGAKVIELPDGNILFEQPMEISQARAVLEHMKSFDVIPMVDWNGKMHVHDKSKGMITAGGRTFDVIAYEAGAGGFELAEVEDLADFVNFNVYKILTAGDEQYLNENWKEMAAPFENELSCMFTSPFYFEYTAKDVDKGKSLQAALTKLGIKAENVMAFGDAPNDQSMLEWAGYGVCMGNGHEDLKAIADEVTLSNDEEGIAASLKRHGLV